MKALSLVMLLIFFGVIAGGTILENAAVMKFFDRSRFDFREREIMRDMLDELVRTFNELVFLDADDEQNPVLENIRNRYAVYNLSIKDVSSGFNLNFLPDADLSDPGIAEFLFANGNAEGFLRFRRYQGFVTEKVAWSSFLKEESMGSVVCYGWFSTLHKEAETCRMLAAVFGKTGEDLYPIMNDLPLINVNTMDTALIAPLISRRSWRINNAVAKATAIKNRLEQGSLTEGELRSLLDLAENHEVFRYLGVKTAFWSLSFKKGRYRMDAVLAAIPERGTRTIMHYTLIEGRLSRAV